MASLDPQQREALLSHYLQSLASAQGLVTRYMQQLNALADLNAWDAEVWAAHFGKETPLSALQKLLAIQKTAGELWDKAEQRSLVKQAEQKAYRLKEEDWRILEMALTRYKREQTSKPT